jgi:carboxymethylenebutenolidase
MTEFDINGRTVEGYLALPERGHGPGVLVLHAWWGLTPFFKEDQVRTEAALVASVEFLSAHEAMVGEGLGALGFSAGAAWALLLSVRKPDLIRAVVAFYGTGLWLQSEYSVVRAAYLGHYAELDEWEPVDEVLGTQEALRAAGCEVTFYTYPGVGHWFFEEDRPDHYDAQAARFAWERTVEFLHARLGPN